MKWYDPITERWYSTKEKPPEVIPPVVESHYERAERLNKEHRIWEAIVDVFSQ